MASLFLVTIRVPGNDLYQIAVAAEDEWKARTRAMARYPYPIKGKTVDFEVTR